MGNVPGRGESQACPADGLGAPAAAHQIATAACSRRQAAPTNSQTNGQGRDGFPKRMTCAHAPMASLFPGTAVGASAEQNAARRGRGVLRGGRSPCTRTGWHVRPRTAAMRSVADDTPCPAVPPARQRIGRPSAGKAPQEAHAPVRTTGQRWRTVGWAPAGDPARDGRRDRATAERGAVWRRHPMSSGTAWPASPLATIRRTLRSQEPMHQFIGHATLSFQGGSDGKTSCTCTEHDAAMAVGRMAARYGPSPGRASQQGNGGTWRRVAATPHVQRCSGPASHVERGRRVPGWEEPHTP